MVLCGLSASIFKKKKLPSTPKKKNPAQIQLKTNMNAQDIFLWKEGGGETKTQNQLTSQLQLCSH